MSTRNSDLIFIAEVKSKFSKNNTIEENIKIAMNEVKNHWLICQYNDEKKSFQTAILAVSSFYGIHSPEFARISVEMKLVNAMFLTPSNVPIDYKQLSEDIPKNHKPIGIVNFWRDINKK